MKIVRKISTCIFLLGFLCGVCAIPIVILGLPELTNIYRSRVDTNLGDWVAILGLGGVLLGFFITVLILIRVIRQVVLPVRIAAEFADKLANGEFPDRLSEERKANDEIQTLYTALNLLRDRQQNLNSKLKLSLSREATCAGAPNRTVCSSSRSLRACCLKCASRSAPSRDSAGF